MAKKSSSKSSTSKKSKATAAATAAATARSRYAAWIAQNKSKGNTQHETSGKDEASQHVPKNGKHKSIAADKSDSNFITEPAQAGRLSNKTNGDAMSSPPPRRRSGRRGDGGSPLLSITYNYPGGSEWDSFNNCWVKKGGKKVSSAKKEDVKTKTMPSQDDTTKPSSSLLVEEKSQDDNDVPPSLPQTHNPSANDKTDKQNDSSKHRNVLAAQAGSGTSTRPKLTPQTADTLNGTSISRDDEQSLSFQQQQKQQHATTEAEPNHQETSNTSKKKKKRLRQTKDKTAPQQQQEETFLVDPTKVNINDFCDICKINGDLMICFGKYKGKSIGCGKSVHIGCVGRTTIPSGDWICSSCARAAKFELAHKNPDYGYELNETVSEEEEVVKEKENQEEEESVVDMNLCFVCKAGGILIECYAEDGGREFGCHKLAHAACIGRSEIPKGDWICTSCAKQHGKKLPEGKDPSYGYAFPPQLSVGSRIEVYWPDDKTYYKADVTSYDGGSEVEIVYDDGVKEQLDLRKEDINVLNPSGPKQQKVPKTGRRRRDIPVGREWTKKLERLPGYRAFCDLVFIKLAQAGIRFVDFCSGSNRWEVVSKDRTLSKIKQTFRTRQIMQIEGQLNGRDHRFLNEDLGSFRMRIDVDPSFLVEACDDATCSESERDHEESDEYVYLFSDARDARFKLHSSSILPSVFQIFNSDSSRGDDVFVNAQIKHGLLDVCSTIRMNKKLESGRKTSEAFSPAPTASPYTYFYQPERAKRNTVVSTQYDIIRDILYRGGSASPKNGARKDSRLKKSKKKKESRKKGSKRSATSSQTAVPTKKARRSVKDGGKRIQSQPQHGTKHSNGTVPDHLEDTTDTSVSEDSDVRSREVQVEGWMNRYLEAKEFRKKNGHCIIPLNYPENPMLARWAKRQRYEYQRYKIGKGRHFLTPQRIRDLDDLGFCWEQKTCLWYQRYGELRDYIGLHGNTLVPTGYPPNKQLATWVKYQRRQKKLRDEGQPSTMTDEQVILLNGLDFAWTARDDASSLSHSL
eukprot:scaffold867_cov112-Cylindrotheca_fusiformis.AAC.1